MRIGFDVAPLLRGPAGSTRTYQLDEPADEGEPYDEVEGQVSLSKAGKGILVKARLQSRTRERCSRCLEPLNAPVDLEFEEEYFATVDVDTGMPIETPDDEEPLRIDEHQTLELGEVIRQYHLAARPLQNLCRPDCKGLCPTCGKNLNLGPCGCPPEPADMRLSVLRRLKTSDEKGGE
jgi:uncharacterized protein